MSTREGYDMEQARERFARCLRLDVEASQIDNNFISRLQTTLTPFKDGFCPVILAYSKQGAAADLALGDQWRVTPSDELLHRLQELTGKDKVSMIYR